MRSVNEEARKLHWHKLLQLLPILLAKCNLFEMGTIKAANILASSNVKIAGGVFISLLDKGKFWIIYNQIDCFYEIYSEDPLQNANADYKGRAQSVRGVSEQLLTLIKNAGPEIKNDGLEVVKAVPTAAKEESGPRGFANTGWGTFQPARLDRSNHELKQSVIGDLVT